MDGQPIDFESAAFALRHSWEVHRQAFGPILEPAFEGDPQARLVLVNALNHISRREIQKGMELLKEIHPRCACDADRAAWAFFVGLCFEMGGARKQMLEWYEKAGQVGHHFYLPYAKLAKAALGEGRYEQAGAWYETTIECLLEMPEKDRDKAVLGASYTNLTTCMTMLHRYPEAEKAWTAAQNYPLQPASDATAAILYAALGQEEKTEAHLAALEEKFPQLAPQTRQVTRQILDGTHPSFPG